MSIAEAGAGPADDTAHCVVYEPTRTGMPPLHQYVRDLRHRWPFMRELVRTDLKAQHYDTVLGQAWLILNPLLMAMVWLLVREVIRPIGDASDRNDIIAHLILGVFMFRVTAELVQGGAKAITQRKSMVMNTYFPRLAFPLVDLMKAMVQIVPTMAVYAAMHLLLQQPVTWELLWFPFILVLQLGFSFGVGLAVGALTVFYRDIDNFTTYIVRLWMFCTPILYSVSEIPEKVEPYLRLNPLFPYFAAYENIMDGSPPGWGNLAYGGVWAVAALVVGLWIYLRRERDFAIWI